MRLDDASKERLRQIAWESIRHGLQTGLPYPLTIDSEPLALREKGASFVTLKKRGQLRGCIGSLEAVRPLAEDVNRNAFAAAFEDPRFPPLDADEFPELDLRISVLTPSTPIACASEEDLARQLRPGIDGLILQSGLRRATFLPAVWEDLPDPRQFIHHLKRKAGIPVLEWPDDMRCWRYEVESF